MGQQHEDEGAQAEVAFVKHPHVATNPEMMMMMGGSSIATTNGSSHHQPSSASTTFGLTHASSSQQGSPVSGVAMSKLKRAEFSLRLTALIASLSAFVFLITDKQTNSFQVYTAKIVQEARFTDVKALIYTVVVLGVVTVYSLLQLLKVIIIDYSSIAPESALAWTIFLCDQLLAYIMLSASSASTQVAWFSEQGNDGLGWLMVCNLYGKFCKQIGAGLVASFLAFLALLFTSGISLFNLFANPED